MPSRRTLRCRGARPETLMIQGDTRSAKALIRPDGVIEEGWIGGGCARAAVLKAARQCMIDGQSRLVSIAPKDLLEDLGVSPGEESGGVTYAKNSCPSQGTMDIFVEPVLPNPRLLILGASPVAVALAELAPALSFDVTIAAPAVEHSRFPVGCAMIDGLAAPGNLGSRAFIVVSTQGAGDRAGLEIAAGAEAQYRAFVGSRRKAETLRQELAARGVSAAGLAAIKAPAGLNISAISSEEIALSILAEMIAVRRQAQNIPNAGSTSSGAMQND